MSEPKEIKITAPSHLLDAATRAVVSEIGNFHRYDKVGWGWNFYDRLYPGAKFFVRRTKAGLSVKAFPAAEPTEKTPS